MKRTPLKRGTKQMKRGTLKKKSKQKISTIQNKIWEHCKRLTRTRYGNVCYTCGQVNLSGSNWHTGHLWSKASLGAYLKYSLNVLRPQCYNCNINRGGQGADFYARMLKEIGSEAMEKLESDRQVTVKAYDFYIELLEKYQKL